MKTQARLAALFAAGILALAGIGGSAFAGSAATDAFVAAARPNIDFLDRSSRLALDKTKSAAVRAFAHSEAVEQTIAANSLVAWTQANTLAGTSVALGTPVLPAPVVAEAPADAAGEVVTGRSAAEGRPLTVTRAATTTRDLTLPATEDNLARLAELKGREFDALYRTTQRESLAQLSTAYGDYARRGDDAGLRALAIRELPKINRRLAELRRL